MMTTLRTSALWLGMIAFIGCGSETQVTGPSSAPQSIPQSGNFPQSSAAGARAPGLAIGADANASANGGAPIVAMSMVIPKKAPATAAAAPAAPGGAPAAPGGAPAAPGGAPAAPGGAPAAPGGAPAAPGGAPAAPGGAPAAPGGMAPAQPAQVPAGAMTPVVPEVKGDCPMLVGGTITFMGLGGITVAAGAPPSGPTAPFVFYWHGTGSFAGEYAGMAADVAAGVQAEGGVLVAFDGTTGGDFLSGTAIFGMGDMDIGDQLLACAVKNHGIDTRRVYATGCSAGGLFSTAQAAMRSNYMAAAAPNSGGLTVPVQFQGAYTPALMTVHGAPGSDVVGIDFSESSATADMTFKQRMGFVINCNHGGGHCGGGGLAGDIWSFFKAHPYGTSPSPWASGLPAGFNPVCKIF